jgi:NAD dependent epimerase/dehydratase family enzyme
MLLEGAYVYPQKAQTLGFVFKFEKADAALADLLGRTVPGRQG